MPQHNDSMLLGGWGSLVPGSCSTQAGSLSLGACWTPLAVVIL